MIKVTYKTNLKGGFEDFNTGDPVKDDKKALAFARKLVKEHKVLYNSYIDLMCRDLISEKLGLPSTGVSSTQAPFFRS